MEAVAVAGGAKGKSAAADRGSTADAEQAAIPTVDAAQTVGVAVDAVAEGAAVDAEETKGPAFSEFGNPMNSRLKAIAIVVGSLTAGWLLRGMVAGERTIPAKRAVTLTVAESAPPIIPTADHEQNWTPSDPDGSATDIATILAHRPGMDRLNLLIEFLAKASGTEMAALAEALPVEWPIPRFNDDLSAAPEFLQWRLLFACWFELDAEAAHAFSLEKDDSILKRFALEAWAATDPDAAMGAVVDGLQFRNSLGRLGPMRPLDIGYAVWRDDPAKFWEMVMAPGMWSPWGASIEVPEQALLDLTASDPESAAQRASQFRPDALDAVLNRWATTSPEAMMRWAFAEQPGLPGLRASLIFGSTDRRILAIEALAKSDPNKAAAWLEQHTDSEGVPLNAALASAWALQDASTAMAWASDLIDPQQRRDALVAVASATSKTDPFGAAKVLASINWHVIDTPGIGGVTQTIWRGDSYITAMGTDHIGNGQSVAIAVLRELASHDPEAAMAYVAEISDIDLHSEARESVWETIVEGNTNIATEMAIVAATEQGETAPLETLLRKLAREDPETAFHLAQEITADLPTATATAAFDTALGAMAAPKLAAGMISELDPQTQSLISPQVFRQITRDWSRADLTGATAWVSTLPPGIKRDVALSSLVSEIRTLNFQTNFSSVLDLAELIEDPSTRRSVATELFEQWQVEAPESLVQAVADETLSADFREILSLQVRIPNNPN